MAQAKPSTLCYSMRASPPSRCRRRRSPMPKAIRLIEDILVVSELVCRASFPVRPDCDLEAPSIFVARLGDVKDHRAWPLALRRALHQRKIASPRHVQLRPVRCVRKVFDPVDVSKRPTERFVVAED